MFHNVSYMFIWQHVHSTSGRIWMNLVGGLERFRINDSYHDRISDGLVDGWLWDAMSIYESKPWHRYPRIAGEWMLMDVYSPSHMVISYLSTHHMDAIPCGPPWSTMVHHGPPWSTMVHHGPPWSTMVHQVGQVNVKSHLDLYIVIACRLCHRDTVGGISRFCVHDPLRTWAEWQAWNGMSMEQIWWNIV